MEIKLSDYLEAYKAMVKVEILRRFLRSKNYLSQEDIYLIIGEEEKK